MAIAIAIAIAVAIAIAIALLLAPALTLALPICYSHFFLPAGIAVSGFQKPATVIKIPLNAHNHTD